MKKNLYSRLASCCLFALLCAGNIFAADHPALKELNAVTTPFFPGEEKFRARLADLPGSKEPGSKEPLGILLSGGSARAFAHIGVLDRLEEADVHPDFIVANSMGAIVAMLYAAGLSPDDIESLISSAPISQLFQPELPIEGGILDPSAFIDVLYNIFGELRIEDLPIPIIIVCDDLVTKQQVWFAEGDFYTILRASFAMPFYFNPVQLNGFRLVDGGTTNLIPVNILAEFTSRMITAATFYNTDNVNYTNPITILNLDIGIANKRRGIEMIQQYNPYLIRCDVENISFMDYGNVRGIVKRGYNSVDREIDAILAAVGTNHRDLSAIRESLQIKLASTQNRLLLERNLYRKNERFSAKLSINFPSAFGSDIYLLEDPYFSGGVMTGKGYFSAEADAASTFVNPAPEGIFRLKAGPFGPLDFSAFTMVSEERYYAQGKLTAKWLLPKYTRLEYFITSEILTDMEAHAQDGYHRTGFSIDRPGNANFTQALSVYAFARESGLIGVGGETSLVVAPVYPLEIRGRYLARYDASGSGSFPIFDIDGYRGSIPKDTTIPHHVANLEFALNANKLNVSCAETLLIQRFDLALFYDVLQYSPNFETSTAAGASITTTLSLIGLKPFSATVYGSYDFTAQSPVYSLRIGSLF